MTNEQTLEQFLKVLNTNAYLGIFECSDMENAISALEKQIPKKAKKSDREIRYCEVFECPSCGFEFSSRVSKYCYRCGQALDWSYK